MPNSFTTRVLLGLGVMCILASIWFFSTRPSVPVIDPGEFNNREREITIIPGWDLRDVARYVETIGVTSSVNFFRVTGGPAKLGLPSSTTATLSTSTRERLLISKPADLSFEGYLAPNTYRIYRTASSEDIVNKLLEERDHELSDLYEQIAASGRTVHEILTMASLLEREVRHPEDRALVADIFWRRHDTPMRLQADSSVHYAVGKEGEVFTTAVDRASTNPWNTYKYAGLPPGPISNPSIESIKATLNPQKNNYWYFLTTLDTGEVKYARTLAEHNENVRQFLKK